MPSEKGYGGLVKPDETPFSHEQGKLADPGKVENPTRDLGALMGGKAGRGPKTNSMNSGEKKSPGKIDMVPGKASAGAGGLGRTGKGGLTQEALGLRRGK